MLYKTHDFGVLKLKSPLKWHYINIFEKLTIFWLFDMVFGSFDCEHSQFKLHKTPCVIQSLLNYIINHKINYVFI